MGVFKLIYFRGCPSADKAKSLLEQAGIQFEEIHQDGLPHNHPLKGYTSPTVLQDDQIAFGAKTGEGTAGCSLNIPSLDELKRRFTSIASSSAEGKKTKGGILSAIGSIGSAATVGLCPVCIPAIGAFLSAIGLGFLAQEAVLKTVLLALLTVTVFGLFWSYLKAHRRIAPFLVGMAMAVGLYVGRYIYLGSNANTILTYGSIFGIIAVSFWNMRLKKREACPSCAK